MLFRSERDRAPARAKSTIDRSAVKKSVEKTADTRRLQKELKTLEKTVVTLDEQRKLLNDQLMVTTDPKEALRLHNEVKAIEMELGTAEERWLELSAMDLYE